LENVAGVLEEDDGCAVLPGRNAEPILTAALVGGCSMACLRLLLAAGAQVRQVGARARTPLDALLAISVPELVIWTNTGRMIGTGRGRPDVQKLYVDMAIQLLKAGAGRRDPDGPTGFANHNCARCVREYHDVLAALVWRRWVRSERMRECFYQIGSYLSA
jgi:hypothetical protein